MRMYKTIRPIVIEFLRESNAIEGVVDDDSLTQAIIAWDYLIQKPELSVGVVLNTHKILMLNQPLQPNERGYFRRCGVSVGGRYGLEWYKIPETIWEWCERANLYPRQWRKMHIEYEVIHPFIDGNGRTGRMFLNWQRLKCGYEIKVIKNAEKEKYYRWFHE